MTQTSTDQINIQDIKAKIIDMIHKSISQDVVRKKLIQNPLKVFEEVGIPAPKSQVVVKILENTDHHLHIVVPKETLSPEKQVQALPNQPTFTQIALFVITQIQNNTKLKPQLLTNPVTVLQQQHINFPAHFFGDTQIFVHQNNGTTYYLTIPTSGTPTQKGSSTTLIEIEVTALVNGLFGMQESSRSGNAENSPSRDYNEGQTTKQNRATDTQKNFTSTEHKPKIQTRVNPSTSPTSHVNNVNNHHYETDEE